MLNVFIVFSLFEKMDLLSLKSKRARLLGQGYRAQGFPDGSVIKNPPANAGTTRDVGSIPGLKKFPGGENGDPPQCSCQGNPMDREAGRLQSVGLQRVRHRTATLWGIL